MGEWGVITNGKGSNTPLSAISKRHLLNKTFNSPLNAKSKCHLLDRNRNTRLNASSQFYLFNKNSDLLNKKCDTSVKTVSTTASEVDQEDDNYKNFLLYLKDRGQTEDMCSLSSGLTKGEPSRITRCISNPVVSLCSREARSKRFWRTLYTAAPSYWLWPMTRRKGTPDCVELIRPVKKQCQSCEYLTCKY